LVFLAPLSDGVTAMAARAKRLAPVRGSLKVCSGWNARISAPASLQGVRTSTEVTPLVWITLGGSFNQNAGLDPVAGPDPDAGLDPVAALFVAAVVLPDPLRMAVASSGATSAMAPSGTETT
jgi:hypothetical protein